MTRLVKHEGPIVLRYPYGLIELQQDNPGVIFTLPLEAANLVDYKASFVLDSPQPEYDPEEFWLEETDPFLQDGEWFQSFRLNAYSQEEKDAIYNAKANWAGFYNGCLIQPAFAKARAAAAVSGASAVCYIDIANALGLAAQGSANIPAIQVSISNLMSSLIGDFVLTKEEKDSLQSLLEACFLDRLISLD
ncbi:hypothetical protein [Synechococcus elongatus]|uniref:hypothetical protein n=1 Tax=Synechococcus elongatus TaxID=32046 RepID=UPI000F7F929F|nr:hypothetical protein [Synechococcus elongatus]